tara:strand:+ start:385853 stop:386239 length:387 start_codon:yes stop_codon:yes gene_type:complete
MNYGYKKEVRLSFSEAVAKVTETLAAEGFGVLTTIDVKATMKQKLDVDFDNYIILGACNPSFAHKALQAEKDIGLLLPCNVIVYEHEGKVYISAILPTVAMNVVENHALGVVAKEVEQNLISAIDAVE